jgi:hypothetical protein
MKKLIALFLLAFPTASFADYVDVIAVKMVPGCTMATYLQVVKDFNQQWGAAHGYKVEILAPMQGQDLSTYFWVGRIANAEAFGKGLDAWHTAQADPNSTAAKLMARLRECTTIERRAGYFAY